jgi:hypothetical protein
MAGIGLGDAGIGLGDAAIDRLVEKTMPKAYAEIRRLMSNPDNRRNKPMMRNLDTIWALMAIRAVQPELWKEFRPRSSCTQRDEDDDYDFMERLVNDNYKKTHYSHFIRRLAPVWVTQEARKFLNPRQLKELNIKWTIANLLHVVPTAKFYHASSQKTGPLSAWSYEAFQLEYMMQNHPALLEVALKKGYGNTGDVDTAMLILSRTPEGNHDCWSHELLTEFLELVEAINLCRHLAVGAAYDKEPLTKKHGLGLEEHVCRAIAKLKSPLAQPAGQLVGTTQKEIASKVQAALTRWVEVLCKHDDHRREDNPRIHGAGELAAAYFLLRSNKSMELKDAKAARAEWGKALLVAEGSRNAAPLADLRRAAIKGCSELGIDPQQRQPRRYEHKRKAEDISTHNDISKQPEGPQLYSASGTWKSDGRGDRAAAGGAAAAGKRHEMKFRAWGNDGNPALE